MIRTKIPQARYSPFVIIAVGISAWYIGIWIGIDGSSTILAAGLLLDILGAIILAIPDVPQFRQYFFSGKLQEALDTLKLHRGSNEEILVEPGTSDRLIDALYIAEKVSGESIAESDLIDTVTRNTPPPSDGFYELRAAFKEGTNDQIWDRVYGFKAYKEDHELRTIVLYDDAGDPAVKLRGRFDNPFDKIEDKIQLANARFRRNGLSLLSGGFLLQGFSILL